MIEHVILGNLIHDENYCRYVLPYLKEEYFQEHADRTIFNLIHEFVGKYNALPSKEALFLSLSNNDKLNENQFRDAGQLIESLEADTETNREFLVEQTEKFAQDRALVNALRASIAIVDDPKTGAKGTIPKLLQDALAVSFDPSIGHDYFDDFEKRFDEYHSPKNRLPFDIDYLNWIFKGGMLPSTMLILLASTGGGKSLTMCHMAASHLMMGKNVIYFTMEMSEVQIGQRIDHNLLGVPEDELMQMSKDTYTKRLARVKERTKGKYIIKEYPSGGASAAHFRRVLEELRIKRNFKPDVIYVDYLNICASSRMKMGGAVNTYVLVKSVAEELRGLAQEYKIPLITATQTNRDGFNASDVDMTNISDSVGSSFTCDYMLALISSEELDALGQVMFKQLKNRYGDKNRYNKFVVGIDRPRMKLFNVEAEAQEELHDGPVMDKTNFGEEDNERRKPKSRFAGFR